MEYDLTLQTRQRPGSKSGSWNLYSSCTGLMQHCQSYISSSHLKTFYQKKTVV
jgi:hypothetical protein